MPLSITSDVPTGGSGDTIPAMAASPTEVTTLPTQSFAAPISPHLCEEAVKKLLFEKRGWVTTAGSYSPQPGCRLVGNDGLNVPPGGGRVADYTRNQETQCFNERMILMVGITEAGKTAERYFEAGKQAFQHPK